MVMAGRRNRAIVAGMFAALLAAAPAAAQDEAGTQPQPAPALDAAAGETPEEIAWHVRAGLNVAALACRDGEAALTVARYNGMLASHRVPLAMARAGVEARLRARYGAAWQQHDDDAMTRLYNHFAAPGAHDAFCVAARAVLRDSAQVAPEAFFAFASAALTQLEQPFMADGAATLPPAQAPGRSLVEQARYVLAARDDAPRIAYATNARVPLAPVGGEVLAGGDTRVADAPRPVAARPADPAMPGFSSNWP